jgi:protein phosphatase
MQGREHPLNCASVTHIGYLREENQDCVETKSFPGGVLALVCDGMGGERAGKEASTQATTIFMECMQERCQQEMQTHEIRNAMTAAVSAANTVIYTSAKLNYQNFGMGTTCVAAFWSQDGVTIVNVGDSRAYCYADGVLQSVTVDHTFVNFLLDSGEITEEELASHPMRHMLIRAVGVEKTVEVDDFFLPHTDGMKILLCSDGLHGFCTEEEIQTIMQQEKPAQELADALLQLALEKGGKDNIAIAVITE